MYQPNVVGNKPKVYDLNTVVSFGKYKDYTIKEILEIEPSYIDWCIYKEIFDVTAEVADELEVAMNYEFEQEGPDMGDSLSIY